MLFPIVLTYPCKVFHHILPPYCKVEWVCHDRFYCKYFLGFPAFLADVIPLWWYPAAVATSRLMPKQTPRCFCEALGSSAVEPVSGARQWGKKRLGSEARNSWHWYEPGTAASAALHRSLTLLSSGTTRHEELSKFKCYLFVMILFY